MELSLLDSFHGECLSGRFFSPEDNMKFSLLGSFMRRMHIRKVFSSSLANNVELRLPDYFQRRMLIR